MQICIALRITFFFFFFVNTCFVNGPALLKCLSRLNSLSGIVLNEMPLKILLETVSKE